jgi:hypothetical protein
MSSPAWKFEQDGHGGVRYPNVLLIGTPTVNGHCTADAGSLVNVSAVCAYDSVPTGAVTATV